MLVAGWVYRSLLDSVIAVDLTQLWKYSLVFCWKALYTSSSCADRFCLKSHSWFVRPRVSSLSILCTMISPFGALREKETCGSVESAFWHPKCCNSQEIFTPRSASWSTWHSVEQVCLCGLFPEWGKLRTVHFIFISREVFWYCFFSLFVSGFLALPRFSPPPLPV